MPGQPLGRDVINTSPGHLPAGLGAAHERIPKNNERSHLDSGGRWMAWAAEDGVCGAQEPAAPAQGRREAGPSDLVSHGVSRAPLSAGCFCVWVWTGRRAAVISLGWTLLFLCAELTLSCISETPELWAWRPLAGIPALRRPFRSPSVCAPLGFCSCLSHGGEGLWL